MAEIGEVIVTKLTGYAGLSALISSRVYPGQLPQRPTLPSVTYQRVSTILVATRDNSGRANLERPRYQFDCWATTRKAARAPRTRRRSGAPGSRYGAAPRCSKRGPGCVRLALSEFHVTRADNP